MTCALLLLAMVAASLHSSLSSSEVHFSQSVYTVTVNETAPPDHPRPQSGFLTLTCTPNSSYIIHYPTSNLPFEIDPDTGELNATADIDYDSMEEGFELFTFNVSCSDSFNNASALALVQVYVAPVNEFLPEIDHSLVLNITEATPSGSLLLSSLPGAQRRLLVHDRDRGPHGQLNFTLLTSLSDHFSFDPIHGNLTLVRAIDFESEQSMFTYIYLELPVKIRVCDRDIDIEACPIIHFPLFIIASDDNEPAFLNTSYSATVNESIAVGSSLLTLECFDADVYIGVVRRITFLDPPADVEQTFSLQRSGSPGSVEVVLANELDFDQRNQTYQFEVGCEDFLHTATATITIHILDVNDNAPKFSNPLHETVVVPDTITPGAVHSVRCTDQDSGENSEIVYEILPQHSLFAMDQTGRVLVNIPLLLPDFTLSQSHNISIECRDKGSPSLSSNKTLTLTISKTDSQPPHINISHTSVSVLENSSTGEPVLILSVYDVDSEAVIITIASQSLPGTFAVSPSAPYNHPNYPVLIVNGSLDREDGATHLIHLVAISVSTTAQQQNTSFSLNISVEDVNDNAPKFSNPLHETVVVADTITPGAVHSVRCTDQDSGENSEIVYEILPQHSLFAMDQTGRVLVNIPLLLPDFTLSQSHNISIECRDKGSPSLSSNKTLTLTISKTDSQPPHINISHTSVSVLENSSTGEPVLILSVYDVDSEAVIITIASQSLPGTFAVSPSAPYNHPNYPVLIVNGSLDREDGATHLIHLVAISVSTTAQQQNTSFSLNISVEDVNDNAPKFSNPLHETVVVPDTITPGAVHSVRCTDQDSGENSDIVYEILPQHSLFAVDQTGRVLVNIPLLLPDFTLSQSHNISIECRDKGSPSLSSNKTLTLTISKTDSQPPHINISHTSVSVLENSSTGEPVLILSVYDVDSEAVIITIASQSLPGTFAVSPSAPYNHPNYPVLIVNGSLDREDGATHLIHLVAISVSTTAQQQNTSFSLNISVEDVNDNAPKFSNPLHETVVVPDTITPGAVHSVRCTDQDSGENSEIVYEILPQHSLFAVDQTGRVLVNIPLLLPDFTLSQSHNISIECRDKGSPSLSSNKTLTLTISKTDSQPPHINISHTSVSVLENSSTGEPVLTLSVYDVDSEAVIITIASQSLPGTFAVSPSTPYNHPNYPVLIVNGSLDREDGATHLIHLVAISVSTTAQQQNTSFSLNISVEDVNDNAPKFSNPLHETVVVPDTITPGAVHSVRCTDQDSGENSEIVYEILPQHSLFAVDQTGRVLVNIPLLLPDFTLSQSHNISIECRDKGSPSLSSNKTLTLTISKTDSQPPHINISHTSVSVLENSSTGEPVLTLSVYDVDSEAVIITIASQSLPGTFAVSPSTPYNHPNYPVLIVNGSLDREDGATHLIHLVAISVSTTAQKQNTSFSLNISVEDVNDNAPKCREESTVSLTGGEFRSTTIVSLSCSDADVGLNQRLTYSLTNTAPPLSNGQFTIDQISGELRLEGVVDKGEYRLTVRVSDMGTPPMATDVGIQVNVVEVEKGEVASNESGLPLMLIIIIVVLSVVVLVSMVGGCGLCCCCWYRSRKSKNKDYFVSGSIGLDGMTVIAAPTAVRGTGSIPSHRLVPLMEDVNTVGNDEVTVTFNQATESQTSDFPGERLSELLNEQWPLAYSNLGRNSTKEDLALEMEEDVTVSSSPLSSQTPPETRL